MDDPARITARLRALSREERQADGRRVRTLSAQDCRAAALELRLPLRDVETFALGARLIPARYLRNFGALDPDEQVRLLRSRAAVAGLGGLGGLAVELLARAGVGRIIACDGEMFEESNLNRQILCTESTLGRSKAEALAARLREINPAVEAGVSSRRLDEAGFRELLGGADVALDCLDGLEDRARLLRAAARAGVVLVTAAAAGFSGLVATVPPGGRGPADLLAGRALDPSEERQGVLGPAAAVAAAIQAGEALNILSGPGPALAGKVLVFDLARMEFESLDLGD